MPEEDVRHEYDIAVELCNEGAYSEALVLLERLTKERPDSRHVMYSRGLCLLALGRLEEARAVRDKLSGYGGSSARQFTEKLDADLQERLQEREKALQKKQRRGRSKSKTTESLAERRGSRLKAVLITGFVIVAAILATVWVVSTQTKPESPAESSEAGDATSQESFATGAAPDRYLEVADFYPTGTERSFRYAVFVTPADGEVPNTATDGQDDCVGNPVVNNWPDVNARAKKALTMSNSSTEEIRGVPRNKTLCTIVLPKPGVPLSGKLEGKDIETFSPGGVTKLPDVIASCGKPDHEETWTQLAQYAGLSGKTHWWGRVGLAADDNGAITHVLIRAYSGDKR